MSKQYRYYVMTTCVDCGAEKQRRADAPWKGRCRSCASKELASRPEIKEIMRETGKRVTALYGGVKNAKKFEKGFVPFNKGKKHIGGAEHHNWKGGITPANEILRHSLEYRQWRIAVFERDGFACTACGDDKGGNLNADHIEPWALFPELRFDVDNGRTLCVTCHKAYGAKVRAGKIKRAAILDYGTNWIVG